MSTYSLKEKQVGKQILLVSPFPPSIGGVSVSVQRLYDFLRSSGFSVKRYDTGFRNRLLNTRFLKLAKLLFLPLYIFINPRFDVIHFHVSGVFSKVYISLWRRFFSGKTIFIITLHGQAQHILESNRGRKALECFDRIICVKRGDRMIMPDSLRSRTVEIPAFIPPVTAADPDHTPEYLWKFLERDSFLMLLNGFIICDSRFMDLYGFMDSVRLLEKLRSQGRNADLVLIVIGSGHNRECAGYLQGMKNYCLMKKLEGHVCWVENQNIELWPLLKKVHVLLRPTKSDGDALSIREALYLGKPVISSDVVPRPEGTIIYSMKDEEDLFLKTLKLIDNYKDYVSNPGNKRINFAQKIAEQYETK